MHKRFGSLKLYFCKFMDERAQEAFSFVVGMKSYCDASNEVSMVWKKLLEAMPEKGKHILFDYENAVNYREALAQEEMYKQGFRDSIRIFSFVKKLYK